MAIFWTRSCLAAHVPQRRMSYIGAQTRALSSSTSHGSDSPLRRVPGSTLLRRAPRSGVLRHAPASGLLWCGPAAGVLRRDHAAGVLRRAHRALQWRATHWQTGQWRPGRTGYPNRPGYLCPYKGERYHIPEWHRGMEPKTPEERFNRIHSSISNVIERSFGLLKMKWQILYKMPSYPMYK